MVSMTEIKVEVIIYISKSYEQLKEGQKSQGKYVCMRTFSVNLFIIKKFSAIKLNWIAGFLRHFLSVQFHSVQLEIVVSLKGFKKVEGSPRAFLVAKLLYKR